MLDGAVKRMDNRWKEVIVNEEFLNELNYIIR